MPKQVIKQNPIIQIQIQKNNCALMLNIIQILWQLQVPNIEVFTTVVHSTKNQSNFYFYSDKKNRILRKKNNSIKEICEYCQSNIPNKDQLTILKFSCKQNGFLDKRLEKGKKINVLHSLDKANQVLITLCNYNQLYSSINQKKVGIQKRQEEKVFVILPAQCLTHKAKFQHKQNGKINQFSSYKFYNFQFAAKKDSTSDQPMSIQIIEQSFFTQVQSKQIPVLHKNLISQIISNWIKQIQTQSNKWFFTQFNTHEEVKVSQISGLIVVKHQNPKIIKIKLIWCFQFILSFKNSKNIQTTTTKNYQLFNFRYKLAQISICENKKVENRQKEQKKVQQHRIDQINTNKLKKPYNSQQHEGNSSLKKFQTIDHKSFPQMQRQVKLQVSCWGCQQDCEKDYKEVQRQDVIALRKMNNLPIRGINQEYYQICGSCYQTL